MATKFLSQLSYMYGMNCNVCVVFFFFFVVVFFLFFFFFGCCFFHLVGQFFSLHIYLIVHLINTIRY